MTQDSSLAPSFQLTQIPQRGNRRHAEREGFERLCHGLV